MNPDETFYCVALRCSGVRASDCIRRQGKKVSGSEDPRFPTCAKCEQGKAIKEACDGCR